MKISILEHHSAVMGKLLLHHVERRGGKLHPRGYKCGTAIRKNRLDTSKLLELIKLNVYSQPWSKDITSALMYYQDPHGTKINNTIITSESLE